MGIETKTAAQAAPDEAGTVLDHHRDTETRGTEDPFPAVHEIPMFLEIAEEAVMSIVNDLRPALPLPILPHLDPLLATLVLGAAVHPADRRVLLPGEGVLGHGLQAGEEISESAHCLLIEMKTIGHVGTTARAGARGPPGAKSLGLRRLSDVPRHQSAEDTCHLEAGLMNATGARLAASRLVHRGLLDPEAALLSDDQLGKRPTGIVGAGHRPARPMTINGDARVRVEVRADLTDANRAGDGTLQDGKSAILPQTLHSQDVANQLMNSKMIPSSEEQSREMKRWVFPHEVVRGRCYLLSSDSADCRNEDFGQDTPAEGKRAQGDDIARENQEDEILEKRLY